MALVAFCGPQSVGCSWFLAFAVVVSSAVLLFVFHRKPLSVWGPVASCGGDEVGLRAVHAIAEWPFVSQRVQLAVRSWRSVPWVAASFAHRSAAHLILLLRKVPLTVMARMRHTFRVCSSFSAFQSDHR